MVQNHSDVETTANLSEQVQYIKNFAQPAIWQYGIEVPNIEFKQTNYTTQYTKPMNVDSIVLFNPFASTMHKRGWRSF